MATDPAPVIPTWFKWTMGLAAIAAVGVAGAVVVSEVQKPMPWTGGAKGPAPKALPPKKKRGGDHQGIELYVLQGDEGDDSWSVMVERYFDVEGEFMLNGDGSSSEILDVPTEKQAVKLARKLGREARESGKYKLVRVVATPADRKRAAARRRRMKDQIG